MSVVSGFARVSCPHYDARIMTMAMMARGLTRRAAMMMRAVVMAMMTTHNDDDDK